MKAIKFQDVDAKLAAAVCGSCSSLSHPSLYHEGPYRDLIRALRLHDRDAVIAASERIVVESVPDEGDPHPRRAHVVVSDRMLRFITPGEIVVVVFEVDAVQVDLKVDFGRDSLVLASEMLARAFLANSAWTVDVDYNTGRPHDVKAALIRALADCIARPTVD